MIATYMQCMYILGNLGSNHGDPNRKPGYVGPDEEGEMSTYKQLPVSSAMINKYDLT